MGIIKKIAVFSWIFIILCFLGCTSYSVERRIATTFACNAIPGAYTTDPHVSRVETIESDQYGRTVFNVKIGNGYGIHALCISQKVEGDYLYYYDNICYTCVNYSSEYDQALLEQVKLQNDWGKPLDLSKCTKKQLNSEKDLYPAVEYLSYLQKKNIEAYIEDVYLAETERSTVWVIPCDQSANNLELYLITVWTEPQKNMARENIENYLMVINKDGSYDPENYLIEFDDLQKSNEPLAEIKEKNGWVPTT